MMFSPRRRPGRQESAGGNVGEDLPARRDLLVLPRRGTVSETRIVSPMPSGASCSRARRVLMIPSGGIPASVTPKCSGTSGRSWAKSRLTSTTTAGSESFSDTQ